MTAVNDRFSDRPTSLSRGEFERLRDMVESELGVLIPPSKRPMLQSRLARRYRELGFEKVQDYCEYLFGDGGEEETTHFLNVITTNFTYFYREPSQLDYFGAELLPELIDHARSRRRPLSIWSAACSTGEETWTLGMMVDDARARLGVAADARLHASDVSTRVLEVAARAVYREPELARLPPGWGARYFLRSRTESDSRVRVVPALRAFATFARVNLMDPFYPVPRDLDAVFLRNVLIYFDRETREAVIRRTVDHLRPGGILALGMAESANGLGLRLQHVTRSIYRKEE